MSYIAVASLREYLNNVANSPMEPEDGAAYGKIAGTARQKRISSCTGCPFRVVRRVVGSFADINP